MTRTALLALATAAAAPAAPLPVESDAAKVFRLYGQWVHPERSCTHRMDGWALRVSLPAAKHAIGLWAEQPGNAPRTATLATGDFTAVVRVTFPPPDPGLPWAGPFTGGGLVAVCERHEFVAVRRTASIRDQHVAAGRQQAVAVVGAAAVPDGPVYLRLARRDTTAATAWSRDGVAWNALYEHRVGWPETVVVGVLAENPHGGAAEVVFDRYALVQAQKVRRDDP